MTRREEIIWLAGLLEGEGWFTIQRNHGYRDYIQACVKSTDRDVIEHAASVFPTGNAIYVTDRRPHKTSYQHSWSGGDAERVMRAVLPFMGERRAARIRECLSHPNLSHTPRERK